MIKGVLAVLAIIVIVIVAFVFQMRPVNYSPAQLDDAVVVVADSAVATETLACGSTKVLSVDSSADGSGVALSCYPRLDWMAKPECKANAENQAKANAEKKALEECELKGKSTDDFSCGTTLCGQPATYYHCMPSIVTSPLCEITEVKLTEPGSVIYNGKASEKCLALGYKYEIRCAAKAEASAHATKTAACSTCAGT